MENLKYTIYKLVDPSDNQIRYVGLTFNSLKQRLKSHLSEFGKSHKIYWIKKLKKQGLIPIIESVEEDISTYEKACEREIYYIDFFKSIGCDLTNMSTGGNKNKKMSDETRRKMSESQTNRNKKYKRSHTAETKNILRRSAIKRFENIEERNKLKLSNKNYENSKTDEQKLNDILIQNHKFVYQYDKQMNFLEKYPSIRDASRKTNISRSNISKCCKHKVSFVGGFVWRFDGDLTPPKYKNRKIVEQYDLEMNFISEFENSHKASIETGISDTKIRTSCKNKNKSAGGFIWKYKDDI